MILFKKQRLGRYGGYTRNRKMDREDEIPNALLSVEGRWYDTHLSFGKM